MTANQLLIHDLSSYLCECNDTQEKRAVEASLIWGFPEELHGWTYNMIACAESGFYTVEELIHNVYRLLEVNGYC